MNQAFTVQRGLSSPTDAHEEAAKIVAAIRAGDRRALAKALTLAEHRGDFAAEVQRQASTFDDLSYVVGITGPPGAGKSTLVAAVIDAVRRMDNRVAALAVDPTSPISGGALLGDRIRMQRHAIDGGAFIRSVASQGQSGGLALSTPRAVRLLGLAGFDWILVETVGIGQVEIDIAKTADTTVVVLNPGGGDDVQASKGGLLEVADILVVNKADRDGAKKTRRELLQMLSITRLPDPEWVPPIVMTVAETGEGIDELWAAIEKHKAHLHTSQQLATRRMRRGEVEVQAAMQAVMDRLLSTSSTDPEQAALYAAVTRGEIDAFAAAYRLLEGALPDNKSDAVPIDTINASRSCQHGP